MELDLDTEILKLTLTLYNNPLIPRAIVQFFIETLLCFIFDIFVPIVVKHLKSMNNNDKVIKDLEKISRAVKEIFEKYKTEYNRFETYKARGFILEPQCIDIDRDDGKVAFYILLKWTLRKFLEIPGAYKILKDHMDSLYAETGIISNFIQGQFWKEKLAELTRLLGVGKFFVPLFMFCDDVELGNALGSHSGSNKIGAVYFSIPSFPSYFTSILSNIFVNTLFYGSDRSKYGNAKVFHRLVEELNDLRENGLEINVNDAKVKIYFQLSMILGDNLGLHALLGFYESFNSKCPCRVCKAFIDNIKKLTKEDPSLLRKREDYEEDCLKQNQNATGISERCFFHRVFGYHVTENICLDLMHDLFEGFGNFAMVKILHYRMPRSRHCLCLKKQFEFPTYYPSALWRKKKRPRHYIS